MENSIYDVGKTIISLLVLCLHIWKLHLPYIGFCLCACYVCWMESPHHPHNTRPAPFFFEKTAKDFCFVANIIRRRQLAQFIRETGPKNHTTRWGYKHRTTWFVEHTTMGTQIIPTQLWSFDRIQLGVHTWHLWSKDQKLTIQSLGTITHLEEHHWAWLTTIIFTQIHRPTTPGHLCWSKRQGTYSKLPTQNQKSSTRKKGGIKPDGKRQAT